MREQSFQLQGRRSNVTAAAMFLGLAMIAVRSARAADQGQSVKLFSRDSVAYGRTYGDWAAAWWQWALSIPVSEHPLFDNGDCSVGQSGPVWFLGGKFCGSAQPNCDSSHATRTCAVSAGKALFFPIVNTEDSVLEEQFFGNTLTLAELRSGIASTIDGTANLEADLDGKTIPNLQTGFREQSVEFDFTLPDDNLLNAIGEGPFAAGTYSPSVDDGVYVMLQPLPAGDHLLHFHGEFPAFNFSLDVTYTLTVTDQGVSRRVVSRRPVTGPAVPKH